MCLCVCVFWDGGFIDCWYQLSQHRATTQLITISQNNKDFVTQKAKQKNTKKKKETETETKTTATKSLFWKVFGRIIKKNDTL